MKKYNHAFTIAFTVNSDARCDRDNDKYFPTREEMFAGIKKRIADLENSSFEIFEATGYPFDTYENY